MSTLCADPSAGCFPKICNITCPDPWRRFADTSLGVSANRLYGFEPFNVQNTFRCGDIRRRGSADDLVGLEEERRRHREAQGLGSCEVQDQISLRGLVHRQILLWERGYLPQAVQRVRISACT
jgi:hypothetical protein